MSTGAYYFSSRCKVCISPHVTEYHKLYLLEKYDFNKLVEYARTLNEDISYNSFRNHMINHLLPYIKARQEVETNTFTSSYIKERLKEEENIITSIQNKLKNLETIIDSLVKDPLVKSGDPTKLKVLKDLMAEVRLTQESYLRIRKRYLKETTSDQNKMVQDFKKAIEDIPVQYIERIITRLRDMGYE